MAESELANWANRRCDHSPPEYILYDRSSVSVFGNWRIKFPNPISDLIHRNADLLSYHYLAMETESENPSILGGPKGMTTFNAANSNLFLKEGDQCVEMWGVWGRTIGLSYLFGRAVQKNRRKPFFSGKLDLREMWNCRIFKYG